MNNKPIITKKYTHDDEYYYKIIANNIRKYRLEQKMSQEELAELTDISRCYVKFKKKKTYYNCCFRKDCRNFK